MKLKVIYAMLYVSLSCLAQTKDVTSITTLTEKNQRTFLFVHGAWGGGWEYAKVDSILSEKGHIVFRPTLTGLGERSHLVTDEISLSTHITDILNVIRFEDLRNIVLVGHSYGGMVISGVAEQLPERIGQLIYLDAFVPKNGESIQSINGREVWNDLIVPKVKDGLIQYPFGPTQLNPTTDVPHPLKTFTEDLTIMNPIAKQIPASFILMKENGKAMFEEWGSSRAIENDWKVHEMEGGHYAMRDQPDKLVEKLEVILKN